MNLGKTRQINFYNIDNNFYFVDLPGYGYSKMSKTEQEKCGIFIEEYLEKRQNIALVVFVLDIRHNPTANDKLMYDYIIRTNKPCIVIANKADKIAITKVDNQVKQIADFLNPLHDITFLPFSSERKIYCDNLWDYIDNIIAYAK